MISFLHLLLAIMDYIIVFMDCQSVSVNFPLKYSAEIC